MDYEQDYLSNKEIDMEYKFKPFDTEEEAIKYGEKFSTYITTVLVEWEE